MNPVSKSVDKPKGTEALAGLIPTPVLLAMSQRGHHLLRITYMVGSPTAILLFNLLIYACLHAYFLSNRAIYL